MQLPLVTTDIQVRFADIDMLGHVSNAVYGQYFDLGRVDFFIKLSEIEKPPLSVVGSMQMNFLREIKFSDKPSIVTWCSDIEGKRMTVQHKIYVNDKCVVNGSTVLVGFDKETRSSCLLPSHWQPSPSPE